MGKRKEKYSKEFLNKLKSITAKRAKIVIDHILKHGSISTEELKNVYGYDHAPRAVRDVREQGIPIITFKVQGKNDKWIAAYKFGDPDKIEAGKSGGRKTFSKKLKEELGEASGSRCAICLTPYELRCLQIDHCVPYEIGGESQLLTLLCGSCNRAKSWSCEHCSNWRHEKDIEICTKCYWASPMRYSHIALNLIRRLDITWTDKEVSTYEKIKSIAKKQDIPLPEFVKNALRHQLGLKNE